MYTMLQLTTAEQAPAYKRRTRMSTKNVKARMREKRQEKRKHIGIFIIFYSIIAEANKHKTDYENSNNDNNNKLYERSH